MKKEDIYFKIDQYKKDIIIYLLQSLVIMAVIVLLLVLISSYGYEISPLLASPMIFPIGAMIAIILTIIIGIKITNTQKHIKRLEHKLKED